MLSLLIYHMVTLSPHMIHKVHSFFEQLLSSLVLLRSSCSSSNWKASFEGLNGHKFSIRNGAELCLPRCCDTSYVATMDSSWMCFVFILVLCFSAHFYSLFPPPHPIEVWSFYQWWTNWPEQGTKPGVFPVVQRWLMMWYTLLNVSADSCNGFKLCGGWWQYFCWCCKLMNHSVIHRNRLTSLTFMYVVEELNLLMDSLHHRWGEKCWLSIAAKLYNIGKSPSRFNLNPSYGEMKWNVDKKGKRAYQVIYRFILFDINHYNNGLIHIGIKLYSLIFFWLINIHLYVSNWYIF